MDPARPRTLRHRMSQAVTMSWFFCGCARIVGPAPSAPDATPDVAGCPGPVPACVSRPAGDPCAAWQAREAVCAASTGSWSCPEGARRVERAPAETWPDVCLPFHASVPESLRALRGSLVRVPVDADTCAFVAEELDLPGGGTVRNVALTADPSEPIGSCPSRFSFTLGAPVPLVRSRVGDDPSLILQVTGGFVLGAVRTTMVRMFQLDPGSGFGVRDLGSSFGVQDPQTRRFVVPGPNTLPFFTDTDLGDATLVHDGKVYVWGCPGPPEFLTESCVLARFDPMGGVESWRRDGVWRRGLEAASMARVFDAGPWVSAVSADGTGGFLHVYAVGFGTTLETHRARAPEGPWTQGPTLGACRLRADDPHAFCAAPVLHADRADPWRPGELVLSYSAASTQPLPNATVEDAWPRMVRVPRP